MVTKVVLSNLIVLALPSAAVRLATTRSASIRCSNRPPRGGSNNSRNKIRSYSSSWRRCEPAMNSDSTDWKKTTVAKRLRSLRGSQDQSRIKLLRIFSAHRSPPERTKRAAVNTRSPRQGLCTQPVRPQGDLSSPAARLTRVYRRVRASLSIRAATNCSNRCRACAGVDRFSARAHAANPSRISSGSRSAKRPSISG